MSHAAGTITLRADDDIPAIAIVTKEMQNIKGIKDPPLEYNAIVKYRVQTEEVFKKALKTTNEVNQYVERIKSKIEELKAAMRENNDKVHQATIQLIDKLHRHQHTRPTSTAPSKTPYKTSYETPTPNYGTGDAWPASDGRTPYPRVKSSTQESPAQSDLGMKCLKELLEMENLRNNLERPVIQTQVMADKMQNNISLTNKEFDTQREKIKSLQSIEQREMDEENRRKEEEQGKRKAAEQERKQEEQRRRRDVERQKREDTRQRQREEAEQRREEEFRRGEEQEQERTRQEEEERERKEQEERERRERERRKKLEEERERPRVEMVEEEIGMLEEEEERRLEEEAILKGLGEERLKQAEEERLRKEEDERQKQEEEERRRQEEEAGLKRFEEEARRRRDYNEWLAAEQRERERRRRLDHNNWEPMTYARDVAVDGGSSSSHHQGVCCVITAVQDGLSEEDLQCLASDDADDIVDALDDGDKAVSSVVSINSKKDRINLEAPMRAYVPCQSLVNSSDEISMKVSVNGSDWVAVTPLESPERTLVEQKVRLVGVELNDFEKARIVAVARARIMVNNTGACTCSSSHKHGQLFVPRDAVKETTELKLSIIFINDEESLMDAMMREMGDVKSEDTNSLDDNKDYTLDEKVRDLAAQDKRKAAERRRREELEIGRGGTLLGGGGVGRRDEQAETLLGGSGVGRRDAQGETLLGGGGVGRRDEQGETLLGGGGLGRRDEQGETLLGGGGVGRRDEQGETLLGGGVVGRRDVQGETLLGGGGIGRWNEKGGGSGVCNVL